MKPAITFALSALVALAAAVPLEKRVEYTTTVIEEVTETVDVVTTVWVQPGDPRLLQQEAAHAPNQQPAPAPAQSTTAVPVYTPLQTTSSAAPAPVQPVPQQKEVVHPAPTSTVAPAPAYTPPPSPAPAPAPAPVVAAAVAPAQSPSNSPASSPGDSGTSGGACGTVGGTCSGDATTFGGALGSCGYNDADGPMGDNYFALAVGMMGPLSNDGGIPSNPYCNRTAVIHYNGQDYPTVLTDKCMGCEGQSIDLSPSLFAQIFDGATTGRFHDVQWSFTGPVVVTST
ncbi:hypothetical protein JMJ35_003221 [Cladonia borealis]|uniref:Uncharacterized protein n=1 Tax=Cladonia borealis TaxID=184061 RepID=A0AA39V6N6_9LECA|nr:hypothetical protein JMJ35_003221 [Cladonia borealis]